MNKSKMSQEELRAEGLRLSVLIQKASEAELLGVKEMSKHPLSSEQKIAQIRRHHAEADRVWKTGSTKTNV